MLRSFWSKSKVKLWTGSGPLAALCLAVGLFVALPRASAAIDFTMTVSPNLSPPAVAPGGSSEATITIVTGSGFSGSITFGCTVTPSVQGTVSNPVCTVSPATMNSSGQATATITTQDTTTTISYAINITATDASGTVTAPTMDLTVLSVTPQFTITVQNTVAPNSVPAGNGAEGIISINPVNGYLTPTGIGKGITLYCATISPLVTIAPFCSFSYPTGDTTLHITNPNAVTSTITISTFGNTTTQCANYHSRRFYAFWFGLPMLGIVGLGSAAGGKRSRKAWILVAVFVVSAGFLLTPSCSNTNNTLCHPNGITPANTYTFTLVGVDSNGVASSNTGTNSAPTVSLTVTAPVQ